MKIELEPGKYVAAVSGGVDSAVLLDLLSELPGVEPVVAHFDHGIRPDSAADREFVQGLAVKYDLPFEYAEGRLGPGAGEATARRARYGFLEKVMIKHRARAIVTAHHQDDALETAVINLLRGTGRKGLSSLSSGGKLERPLLNFSKRDIIGYARSHTLDWREDSTNQDEVYLRNYVRRKLLPRFGKADKSRFLELLERSKATNQQIDGLLGEELRRHSSAKQLERGWFNALPHDVALETMAAWLRHYDLRGFDRKTLERLVVAAKTGRPGQHFDVVQGAVIGVGKDNLALRSPER